MKTCALNKELVVAPVVVVVAIVEHCTTRVHIRSLNYSLNINGNRLVRSVVECLEVAGSIFGLSMQKTYKCC